jgi:uncharacterized phage protein (TIGR02220 family)
MIFWVTHYISLNSKSPLASNSLIISEGFTLADFKLVIDKKVLDWKGTDWEKYLRPITLFSKSKFENYLNANLNEPKRSSSNFTKFADSAERAKQLIGLYTK